MPVVPVEPATWNWGRGVRFLGKERILLVATAGSIMWNPWSEPSLEHPTARR
jgi:hypothetical protein